MFGVFEHKTNNDPKSPIFRGFDDVFMLPHSRHTEVRRKDIEKKTELTILSESDEAGVYIVLARNGAEIFVIGHSEYSPNTLTLNINVISVKTCLLKFRKTITPTMTLQSFLSSAGVHMPIYYF